MVEKEVGDNRAVLEPLVGSSLRHLCYPSGEWFVEALPHLRTLKVCDRLHV